MPRNTLADRRCQQTRHRRLHVIHEIVDDIVVADLDALVVGRLLRLHVGTHVEADDHRLRGRRQRDIRFRDAADAGMHDARLHLVVPSFFSAPEMASIEPCTSPLISSVKSFLPSILDLLHHLLERARVAG